MKMKMKKINIIPGKSLYPTKKIGKDGKFERGDMRMKSPIENHIGFGLSQNISPVTLQERFGVPPFSILDARQGYWQRRKRQWLKLGIQSGLGRGGEDLVYTLGTKKRWDEEMKNKGRK